MLLEYLQHSPGHPGEHTKCLLKSDKLFCALFLWDTQMLNQDYEHFASSLRRNINVSYVQIHLANISGLWQMVGCTLSRFEHLQCSSNLVTDFRILVRVIESRC